jgi:hypothetical protein
MKAKAQKVYLTYLVVEGSGEFPYDMLRYDSCCPDTETDTHRMERQEQEELRRVVLRRFSVSGQLATEARWRSHVWRVVLETPDRMEAQDQVRDRA